MKTALILFSLTMIICGCASTNNYKTSNSNKMASEAYQRALLPSLKAKGLKRYIGLFELGDCSMLLEKVERMGIKPKSINDRKVIIVAHTGEELIFNFPKSCPEHKGI